jgi:predicted ATPase/DNA-binding SARP family transcriptional activator
VTPACEFEYKILGVVSVRRTGETSPVQVGKQAKVVLGRLLLEPGALVSTEALAGALWGEEDRVSRRDGVHHAVRSLRKVLGDTQTPRRVIVLDGDAYRIVVENALWIDAERFKQLAAGGHDLVGEHPRAARAMLDEALSTWRGRLLGEFASHAWAAGHAEELDRMRDRVEVDLNEARLVLGEYADLDGTVRRQIIERPHDERLRGQLIRALLGAGRATEASLAFREAVADLGAVGANLMRLGEHAARGSPALSPATTGDASSSAGGRPHHGSTVLCAELDLSDHPPGAPALGTLCLLVHAHGGAAQPVTGERLIATFDHPDAALRAARAIAADPRISSRIGVHAGTVIQFGDRLIGLAPARCWQLVEAAHPNQILVSAAARGDGSADLRDLGKQSFADLAPCEALLELAHPRGLTFPPPATLSQRPHNLPIQATRFVGRADELVMLSQRIGGAAIISLIGTGGCGKTRLALQVAARDIAAFADGAWFVGLAELEPASDVETVATTIANQLGVRPLKDETLSTAVVRHLSDRAALLILDNCEQVHEACAALVAQLHARCPAICIIATSRRRLGVDGETVIAVQPMATDAEEQGGGLPDAVELLLERAGRLPAGETESADMLAHAALICRAFDGLPLAIELAAGQVATRGLPGVAAEVAAMLTSDRPIGQYASADPWRADRHRTIDSAIAWSYRLLSDQEQRVLWRLAVFRGTFGEPEARRLADDAGPDVEGASALANLVECSMVAPAPPLEGTPRARLLEPIRAFALQLLIEHGDRERARETHAQIYHELAVRTAPGLFGPDEQVCLERLEADHDNLRCALTWYVDERRSEEALQLVGALWWLWFSHGHLGEGGDWVRRVLAIDDVPTRARVRALRAGSHLSWWRGDYAECTSYNVALQACADATDDAWGQAWAPLAFAAVELFQRPHEALALAEESRRRFEALDRRWEAAHTLPIIAAARWFGGDARAAGEAFTEAAAIFAELGHLSVLASAQRGAGMMAARCGNPARGSAMCLQALRLSESIRDRAGSAQALIFVAAISRDSGEHETALMRYSDALSLARDVGELWATCMALDGIAGIARVVGEPEIATRLLAHSSSLAARAGYQQPPHERQLRDNDLVALRSALGDEGFERAAAEGALMSLGEAVSSALACAARHR